MEIHATHLDRGEGEGGGQPRCGPAAAHHAGLELLGLPGIQLLPLLLGGCPDAPGAPLGPQGSQAHCVLSVHELLLRHVEVHAVGGLVDVRQPEPLLHLAVAPAPPPLPGLHVWYWQHLGLHQTWPLCSAPFIKLHDS